MPSLLETDISVEFFKKVFWAVGSATGQWEYMYMYFSFWHVLPKFLSEHTVVHAEVLACMPCWRQFLYCFIRANWRYHVFSLSACQKKKTLVCLLFLWILISHLWSNFWKFGTAIRRDSRILSRILWLIKPTTGHNPRDFYTVDGEILHKMCICM